MFSSHNPSYQNKAHNFILLLFHGGYFCLFILGFLLGGKGDTPSSVHGSFLAVQALPSVLLL